MKKNKQEFLKVLESEMKAMSEENSKKLTESQIAKCAEIIATKFEVNLTAAMESLMDNMPVMEEDSDEVEVEVGAVLGVDEDFTLETLTEDEYNVVAGSFLVLNPGEVEGLFLVDVYDENSNVIETELVVAQDDLDNLVDSGYLELIPPEDITYEGTMIDEAFIKFSHGKLKKFQLKAKKGYKRVGTKYVKISAATIAKMKKNAIKASRKANVGAAKIMRKRTMKIRKTKIHDSVNIAIGYEVKEGFDVIEGAGSNKKTIALESGDCLNFVNDGAIRMTISREGKNLIDGVVVDEAFLNECIKESLIKESGEEVPAEEVPATEVPAEEVPAEEVPATEVPAEEVPAEEVPATEVPAEEVPAEEVPAEDVAEAVLSFRNEKGYILTKEGKDTNLGSRVRARSYLISEGFNVSAGALDSAFAGKKVNL